MPNYRALAAADARRYGIDPAVFTRQIAQESGFNPDARSGAGAIGIAQFMPGTAAGFHIDPHDPVAALDAAARMDAGNLRKYGSYARMLSAYNSGRADAYKDPGFAGGQTYNYVKKILGGGITPNSSVGHAVVAGQAASAMASGSPARQALIQHLLGSLGSFSAGDKQWGFKSLANTVNMIHAQRSAASEAQQYGTQTTATQLSSGHVLSGVNPNSPTDLQAVKLAESYVGTPYKWGGAQPGGFDCSGLLQYTWGKLGVKIPRTTYDQFRAGKAVGPNQLQPGDAVFFRGSDSRGGLPGHVGMYIGGGKYIQAPHTGANVQISTIAGAPDYMGARRFA